MLLTGASGAGQVHAARGAGRDPRRRGHRGGRRAHRRRRPPAGRPGPAGPAGPGPRQPAGHDPRRGRRRLRAGERRPARPRRSGRGWTRRWPPSASRTAGTGRPRRSPAGRSSGWCSPARSPAVPGLLLLDEPTAQLDPRRRRAGAGAPSRGSMADRSATLLVVDHDAGPWLPLVDRVVEVVPGGLVEHGPDWRPRLPRPPGCDLPAAPDGPVLLTAAGRRLHLPRERRPRRCRPRRGRCAAGGRSPSPVRTAPGKSTLALLLAGLRAPTTGRVRGRRRARRGRPRKGHRGAAPLAGRGAGQPHRHGLPAPRAAVPHRPAARRARPGPAAVRASTPRRARATADELLERLGLTAFADANPYTLSGGQQRRLSVATALATSPRVLVLDEPTFGQDAATWRELVTLLAEQRAARLRGRGRHPRRRPGRRPGRRPAGCGYDRRSPLGPVAGTSRSAGSTRSPSSARSPSSPLVLLTSLDVVTPAVVVAAELCLLPAAGLTSPRDLWRRTWPLLLGATSVGAGQRAARPTTRPWSPASGSALRVVGLALPGVLLVASHRPGPAGRRADHPLAGVHPVRLRRAGRAAAGPAAGRRVRVGPAGPAHPWRGGRPQPGGPDPAVRGHRVHAAGRRRPPRAPGWRRRWTPAASTPASPAPTPAARGCTARDAAFVVGTVGRLRRRGHPERADRSLGRRSSSDDAAGATRVRR